MLMRPPYRSTVSHPTLQHPLAVRLRDPRAVVLNLQHQPLARTRALGGAGRETHPASTPLAGVIQKIAENFGEIAAVADELTRRRDHELERQILVRIHMQQRAAQRRCHLRHFDRRLPDERPARGRRALQLVFDNARHAIDLEPQGTCGRIARQARAHDRKRGLEAVREVAECVAIAGDPLALPDEQRVEVARYA
jgi:hypothetical protein